MRRARKKIAMRAQPTGDVSNAKLATIDVQLTPRQRQVLEVVVNGRRMKQAAAGLDLSPGTIEAVKGEIMQALGVRSTAELVECAMQRRLVTIDIAPIRPRRHSA